MTGDDYTYIYIYIYIWIIWPWKQETWSDMTKTTQIVKNESLGLRTCCIIWAGTAGWNGYVGYVSGWPRKLDGFIPILTDKGRSRVVPPFSPYPFHEQICKFTTARVKSRGNWNLLANNINKNIQKLLLETDPQNLRWGRPYSCLPPVKKLQKSSPWHLHGMGERSTKHDQQIAGSVLLGWFNDLAWIGASEKILIQFLQMEEPCATNHHAGHTSQVWHVL